MAAVDALSRRVQVARCRRLVMINVLMYHSIADSPGPTSIPPQTFQTQVETLVDCGYQTISIATFKDWHSGHVTLPKHDRLVAQIVGLERRVSRGGKDSISHPDHAGAHDDLANAVAGAAYCANKRGYDPTNLDWIDGPDPTN